MKRDPQERRIAWLALVPIGAFALFAAVAVLSKSVTEQRQVAAVRDAVVMSGRLEPVQVDPGSQDACPPGHERFRWRAATAEGGACVGPSGDVVLETSEP